MELKTLLFEKPGAVNTQSALDIARERALALGIRQVVVASSHGMTARLAHQQFSPYSIQVIAVSICHSWESKGWTMEPEVRAELTKLGVTVHTGIHALGDGVGSAFSDKKGGSAPEEVVRNTLYRFCQGMKVAVECLLMAADAGLLDIDREVISIAGTDEGADTVIVCKPAYPRTFFDLKILEVLAKPR
jgi:hypothetical protein